MFDIKIIIDTISVPELKEMSKRFAEELVKAVVDIEQKKMAVGGSMHADEEEMMLEQGSDQGNLWGINIYPNKSREEWIEFDSMINIRPSQSNRSRSVENKEVQEIIKTIVQNLVE